MQCQIHKRCTCSKHIEEDGIGLAMHCVCVPLYQECNSKWHRTRSCTNESNKCTVPPTTRTQTCMNESRKSRCNKQMLFPFSKHTPAARAWESREERGSDETAGTRAQGCLVLSFGPEKGPKAAPATAAMFEWPAAIGQQQQRHSELHFLLSIVVVVCMRKQRQQGERHERGSSSKQVFEEAASSNDKATG